MTTGVAYHMVLASYARFSGSVGEGVGRLDEGLDLHPSGREPLQRLIHRAAAASDDRDLVDDHRGDGAEGFKRVRLKA